VPLAAELKKQKPEEYRAHLNERRFGRIWKSYVEQEGVRGKTVSVSLR
jgi:hypothetical protein